MAVRAPERVDAEDEWRPSLAGPPWTEALLLGAAVSLLLLVNGRPIGAGDTRASEHVAASLVQEGDFDLDEYPEVEAPFARAVGAHRVSIYPPAAAVLAAPVFAAARAVFALDENGSALAGKVAASVLSGLAAGVLFMAVGRRRPRDEAALAALVFAFGTSVWSTSQALWQHPATVLFLCLALLCVIRAEDDPAWAGRAGLFLALAVASRHAAVALAAVLALGIAVRWPRRLPSFLLWAAGPLALALAYNAFAFGSPLAHGFAGAAGRFTETTGTGHLGLLVSPAKGLFVFTPIAALALAGVWRAVRTGERFLPLTLLAAAAAHWLLVGFWSEWHGGRAWGPRLMTDALPLLFVFLPEGLDLAPRLGTALAAASVVVQALGAFAYDYRWERLYQHTGADLTASLWDPVRSPIPFYAGRRVLTVALPRVREGRVSIREHPLVAFGPEGSRVRFTGESPSVTGSEATLGDVHLERAARAEDGRVRLRARWDGVFLRVTPQGRLRRLELRLRGRGQGLLYVGERSFWSDGTRWTPYTVSGSFALRHRYHYPESGGPDLTVTVGTGGGDVWLESLALVPPGEPEHVLVGHRSGRPRVPVSAARRRGGRSGTSTGPEADDGAPYEQHGDHQALPEAGQGPGVQGTDERDHEHQGESARGQRIRGEVTPGGKTAKHVAEDGRGDDEAQEHDGSDPVVDDVLERAPGLRTSRIARKDAGGDESQGEEPHERGRRGRQASRRQQAPKSDREGGEHQPTGNEAAVVHEGRVRGAARAQLADHVGEMAVSRAQRRARERDQGEDGRSRDASEREHSHRVFLENRRLQAADSGIALGAQHNAEPRYRSIRHVVRRWRVGTKGCCRTA